MSVDKTIEFACPCCGGDSNKDISATKRLIAPLITSEYVDPGGRALTLSTGHRIRLIDQCYACDERVLLDVLATL